jgi:hypothetical protein
MDLIKMLQKSDYDSYEHGYLTGLSQGIELVKKQAGVIIWEEHLKEEDILAGKIQTKYPDLPRVCLAKRICWRIEYDIVNPRRGDTSKIHDAWMKKIRE